jgi:hypothetical protein
MSDSSPKMRSPIAAYGPIIALVAVLGVALAVLFSLGSGTSGTENLAPDPKATPVSQEEMRAQMGYTNPGDAKKKVEELIKKRGRSWFKLKPDEQQELNRISRGHGREMFEGVISSLEGDAVDKILKKNKK